jgi:hypothetical protein
MVGGVAGRGVRLSRLSRVADFAAEESSGRILGSEPASALSVWRGAASARYLSQSLDCVVSVCAAAMLCRLLPCNSLWPRQALAAYRASCFFVRSHSVMESSAQHLGGILANMRGFPGCVLGHCQA